MKATAIANSNVALIKYWGKCDKKLNLPMNNSISMTLSGTKTFTTVEFSKEYSEDIVQLNGATLKEEKKLKIVEHLDRIRKMAKIKLNARVASENNFPTACGIASSASGFAALSLAGSVAAGLELTDKELSILARLGSGSACRSIQSGYVEWFAGKRSEDSYAVQIAPPEYLDLRDIVAIVNRGEKKISSTKGHEEANSSPFYKVRLSELHESVPKMREAIVDKDVKKIGRIAEKDAISMHVIMMTSEVPLFYWSPETISIIQKVHEWREGGLDVYFTIDAGPNVHVLTLSDNAKEVEKRLKNIEGVIDIIHNRPGEGVKTTNKHMF